MQVFWSFVVLGGISLNSTIPALGQTPLPEEMACESNKDSGEACFNAGIQYANGQGVAEDQTRATELYMKACNGGTA